MMVLTACFLVALPGTGLAEEEYRVIGEITAGPGVSSHVFPLYDTWETSTSSLYGNVPLLKSISVDVLNGAEKTRHRVTSAVVTVNGNVIFRQRDFNARVLSLSKTVVPDPETSEIAVTVEVVGKKKCYATVRLVGTYEIPERIPVTWYLDMDGDEFGGTISIDGFLDSPPPDRGDDTWVTVGGDCNDYNPYAYPGSEIYPCP
jgi:hypothetical protein